MKEKIYNFLPYLVLLSGLIISVLFFQNELRRHQLDQQTYFQDQTDKIRHNIENRLQTYVDEQVAGAAFIAGSEKVNAQDWHNFVRALKLDINYPGIYGLGYAVAVNKQDSLAFTQYMRRQEFPDFRISGFGQMPQASDFFVIKYLEPKPRNITAIGFDMGSEPIRRLAMEKARDTGNPAVSDKVTLVQDKSRTPGFLLYAPVFKTAADTTIHHFLGWSYAPFIAQNFMAGVLKRELKWKNRTYEIELYSGLKADTAKLLYKSWRETKPAFENVLETTIPVYGNTWLLRILPLVNTDMGKKPVLAYVILIGGILLNVSLFFLLQTLSNTRRNAIALAEKMTAELRVLNQSLDQKVEERTRELAAKNKELNNYAENLKNAYEDMEVKVKFRNLQLEKKVKALQDELDNLSKSNG